MPPVRIKYYGLFSITKQTYLLALGIAAFVTFAVLIVVSVFGLVPPLDTMWSHERRARGNGFAVLVHNYFWWFILICLLGQAFDTLVTLRVFAKKEAEQRTLQPGPDTIMEKQPDK